MKKSFTINCSRTAEEILQFGHQLIEQGIYHACELFYPDPNNELTYKQYTNSIQDLKHKYPLLEFILHLPFSKEYNIADIDCYDITMTKLKEAIKYASQFQINRVTLHPGFAYEMSQRERYKHHALKAIKELSLFAKSYNITIMLENLVSDLEYMTSIEEILYFLTELEVGFTLDIGHAAVRKLDFVSLILETKKFLMHTHIHDNHFLKDEHLAIGKGDISFKPIIGALKHIEYSYLLGMEALFTTTNELVDNAKKLDEIYKGAQYD